jgi:hypothetical protein
VLGEWDWDPNVGIVIKGKFHYESNKPFEFPTLAIEKPPLDPHAMIDGPVNATKPVEKDV